MLFSQKGGVFMKNKTLALITAALITAAALILTAGLSLLDTSAIDDSVVESTADSGTVGAELPEEIVTENEAEEAPEEDAPAEDAPAEYPDTTLPALDTLEAVTTSDETGYDNPGFEYVIWKDIVIDVFEHKTGKLVGQVWLTEDELYNEFCKIFEADFDHTAGLFDPNNPEDVPVYIPEAEYRVEFYWVHRLTERASGCCGSLAFSYGVENNEIYEYTQTGYSLANGETVIAFMESLVAKKIAQLENGVIDELEAEESFAHIIGFDGENSCWNGTTLSTGEFIPGSPRYAERFPYLAN